MAVGEGEFQRLDQRVDIGGRVVAQRLRGRCRRECFRVCSSTGPWHQGRQPKHRDVAEPHGQRRFDIDMELRQVVLAHPAVICLVIGDDLPRDVAAVERIARGGQAGERGRPCARGGLLVRHVLDGVRQIGLEKALPGDAAASPFGR